MNIEHDDQRTSQELLKVAQGITNKYKTIEEDVDVEMEIAWDDVSGAVLDAQEVRRARMEEIKFVQEMDLYVKVPKAECYARTGKGPTSVRWIDIKTGDQAHPNYRSRLVARETNTHRREDLFAAPPPLEALKIILSMVTTGNKGEILMVNDISRAFFHARAKRDVCVQLPQEDTQPGDENKCGKLN